MPIYIFLYSLSAIFFKMNEKKKNQKRKTISLVFISHSTFSILLLFPLFFKAVTTMWAHHCTSNCLARYEAKGRSI